MNERVPSRDVLDPNAKTRRAFPARIAGWFRPVGPNPWDDFEFVSDDLGPCDVAAGIEIQVEGEDAAFRMRRQGRVVRAVWTPPAGTEMHEAEAGMRRRAFLETLTVGFENPPGLGGAAVIAAKLAGRTLSESPDD
jgi:hypothetical protein